MLATSRMRIRQPPALRWPEPGAAGRRRTCVIARRVLLAAAGCAVAGVAVAGCGTRHAGMARTPATGTTVVTVQSPRQRAAADAASLLTTFRPPPGTARSGRLAVSPLAQAPDVPMSPDLVSRTQWYQAPGQWQAVYAWILAHPPTGLAPAGSGTLSQASCTVVEPPDPHPGSGSCVTMRDVEFSRPPVPGALAQRWLEISVAGDGPGRAAVRVDAVDVWIPARPAGEQIPASAKVVTIAPAWGVGPATSARPVTITDPATVARIVTVVDGLPVFPPGTMSCPAFQGRAMLLTFRAAAGGPVLAVIQGDTTGCGTVSVTINGHAMLALGDADTMQQRILAIAGVRWPGFPA